MSQSQKTYGSNGGAVRAGIRDLNDRSDPPYDELKSSDRLDGRTVLITGATSGLGLAVSMEMAARGARVLMTARRDAAAELAAVRGAGAGNGGSAELCRADMADFASLRVLIDDLTSRNEKIDVFISNAAVVPGSTRKTVDGYEEMLQVNALAPALLIRGLLDTGVIRNDSFAGNGCGSHPVDESVPLPRIIVVASEAHRSAPALDLENLEDLSPYGMAESTPRYGWTKLILLTFVRELSRRLSGDPGGKPDVSVHALCPGPIASNIAREIPAIARPFAKLFFSLFFQSPATAARPVVYLASSRRIEGQTGFYQFLMRRRPPSALAESADSGRAVWNALEDIIASPERRFA